MRAGTRRSRGGAPTALLAGRGNMPRGITKLFPDLF
jgi:hypothetical protein